MKRRLFSFLLAAAILGGSVPTMAVDIAVDSAEQQLLDEAEAQDGQAYRELHRGEEESAQTAPDDAIRLFASQYVTSPFTGKTYTLPAGKTVTHGVDISKYQEKVDWTKVKKSGVDFAIIRAAYTGYGNGDTYTDIWYHTNMENALSAGLPVGVYIYSQAITTAEAKKEANYVLDLIKGYNVTLPVVFDVEFAEDSSGYTGRLYKANLTKTQQTNICLAFCETIEKAGYTPMVYANKTMLANNMNAATIREKYPIWLANYTTSTSYTGEYDVWQYTDSGSVNGATGKIDCNFGLDLSKWTSGSANTVSVKLNSSAVTLVSGGTKTLKATVEGADSVTWSSSKTSVAKVSSSGKITAVAPGKATITAKAGNASASCTVTVNPTQTVLTSVAATSSGNIRLEWKAVEGATKYYVYRSETGVSGTFHIITTRKTKMYYEDSSMLHGKKYYYRVKALATVDGVDYSGQVSQTLSASAGIGTTSIMLNANALQLTTGGTAALAAKVNPTNSDDTLTWSTSDSATATVSNGVVTAQGVGAVSITATSGAKSDTCTVTVNPAQAQITSAVKTSSGKIKLTWGKADGATRYYVVRSTSGKNGTFTKIASITKTSYTDSGLKAGQTYYYRIRSTAKKGDVRYYGTMSTTVSVKA
ncbi:MAG: GH25 family lysozyme [Butyricicoccus sp.]